jgi:hypothetical protein
MFEDINKKTKYNAFTGSKRPLRNNNKLIYKDGTLTRVQNSYAHLTTNSRLPAVYANKSKTSLDFLHREGRISAQGNRTQRTPADPAPRNNKNNFSKLQLLIFSENGSGL